MAGKFSSLLTICALLSNSQSNNLVTATFNTVSDGVVRIELEKKYINYFENVQLEDMTDIDLMIDSPIGVDDNLLIDSDEMNYSQLREIQRRHGNKQLRQEEATSLAQNDQSEQNKVENPKNNNMVQTEGQNQGQNQGQNLNEGGNKAHTHVA